MEGAFAWIGKLAEFLGSLIPKLLVLEATHSGVAFIRGKRIKPLAPGLHVYWPIWTSVVTLPTVRQTTKLQEQALTTKDGVTVLVGGMIRYEIDDIQKALAESYDIEGIMVDESLAVFAEVITGHSFDDIQADRRAINRSLTVQVRRGLDGYGIKVIRSQLTDFARGLTLIHTGQALGRTPSDSMDVEYV